jgi:hypothetical protein
VPWKKQTHINKDLAKAQQILDDDHYGLSKVKERILEHLAVILSSRVCALTPPKSSCFSAVLSDKLAIIISLKRSTSLPS